MPLATILDYTGAAFQLPTSAARVFGGVATKGSLSRRLIGSVQGHTYPLMFDSSEKRERDGLTKNGVVGQGEYREEKLWEGGGLFFFFFDPGWRSPASAKAQRDAHDGEMAKHELLH